MSSIAKELCVSVNKNTSKGVSMVDLLGRLSRLRHQDHPGPSVYKRSYEATPKQVQARHLHLTSREVQQLVERYRAGEKIKDLAASYKIHRSTATAHLRRAGELKHRGWTEETTTEARRLRAAGLTIAEIALKLGRSRSTIQRRLSR